MTRTTTAAIRLMAPGLLASAVALNAAPATAVTIKPTFDSSITSLSNAATIEAAFNTAASAFSSALTNPVTVNIQVSWGKVNTTALSAGDLGETLDPMLGYYTYSQVKGYLNTAATTSTDTTVLKNLKTTSAAGNQFLIPQATGKALGLVAANATGVDAYIGFGSSIAWTYSESKGTAAGTYDFVAVAKHEIEEALGRVSGLNTASPFYATPFDLFRYSAANTGAFSYTGAAYASIDGGVSNLGALNNSSTGGDRADWLTTSKTTDIQDAFMSTGATYYLSAADLTLLDAMGWSSVSSATALKAGIIASSVTTDEEDLPEPSGLMVLATAGSTLLQIRSRSRKTSRS